MQTYEIRETNEDEICPKCRILPSKVSHLALVPVNHKDRTDFHIFRVRGTERLLEVCQSHVTPIQPIKSRLEL